MATPEQIQEQIEQTQNALAEDVDAMRDKLNPMSAAHRGAARVSDAATRAKDTVMGKAEEGVDRAQGAAQEAADKAHGAADKAQGTMRGNPLAVGLLAFAVGWLASSLIPASNPEKRAAANLRDSDAVQSATQPLADSARSVLGQASEEVRGAAHNITEDAKAGVQSVKETIGTDEGSADSPPAGSTAAVGAQSTARSAQLGGI